MGTFREFNRKHDTSFCLREQEAAPPGGMGDAPADPQSKTSEPHLDFLGRELNARTEDLEIAIQSGPIPLYQIPDYSKKWGFKILPPIEVYVKKVGEDQFRVTFPFEQLYAMNPKKFVTVENGVMVYYQGPVRNEEAVMTREELMNAWAKPLEGGGAGGPMGAMGGMGSMPPIGGM